MMGITMSPAEEEIINAIQAHMSRVGTNPNSWYVGIANNIRKKLFEDRKVSEQNGKWIYRTIENNSDAIEIKKYLISIGLKDEGNDENGNIVFAYEKPVSES
ncbi:MAG TPA: hypothetical protein VGN20_05760 [Mucilaginibacter sp.]|jgi:hypothetical protein